MIYDNCEKYIKEVAMEEIATCDLHNKRIIVYGFDVLSKTFIYFFLREGIQNIEIFDERRIGEIWCGLKIRSEKEIGAYIADAGEHYILITPLRDYQQRVDSLLNIDAGLKNDIHVFNNITMNTMPNNLVLPEDAREISLREAQLLQLKILKWFHEFCEEHNLRYYLHFGTLIGAVRHKGFIPWDEDIDITMPAPDYIKLGKLFPKECEFLWNSVFNEQLEDLPISTLSKIENEDIFTEYRFFPMRAWTGMGIDIFPLCGYPKEAKEQVTFRQEFMYWENVWSEQVVLPYGTDRYSLKTHKKLFEKMNEMLMRYDYDASENIGIGYFGRFYPQPRDGSVVMPKKWYEQSVLMEFEGEKYRIPIGYDEVLKKWYGDYMQLPPVEDRVSKGHSPIYSHH